MDVTQEYIHWYNNITRHYITRPRAVVGQLRSNNARLRDVADDPQQVLDISELDEVYHNVEEVPPMTQAQSTIGAGPSSLYIDVGPSNSYMPGHGRGYREHNEYLYYEVPAEISD
ncbi:GATA zinc finger domain-containing protein 10-like isoform X2 [Cucumis melo var. makuwa]|uniref:GATA zinc finger domain-containing protein 10-like isoform X2 n=1 Tax=Cucumis melo var. makuwa TaxID=1194695 RepID=A0A5D3DTZ6_CUCMM|nr:GATA zinc finger domain-containing protein 10-like isoform X2 [Cucumis melo var. makuwa]TYK26760.1 GATA zinc finger domain-containing protein 10-like isoform X2 [Cucumis melo var. makuwa]